MIVPLLHNDVEVGTADVTFDLDGKLHISARLYPGRQLTAKEQMLSIGYALDGFKKEVATCDVQEPPSS